MKKSVVFAAVAAFAALGFVAPASAGPWTPHTMYLNPLIDGKGQTNVHYTVDPTTGLYAGTLSVVLDKGTLEATTIVAFCDDLFNSISPSTSYPNYFASNPATPSDVASYLGLSLSSSTYKDIVGLVFEGTQLANADTLTNSLGAAYQLAIWELQYGGTSTSASLQASVDTLLADAAGFYADFTAAGWQAVQLEDPISSRTCGINAPGSITLDSKCQNQGLIFVIPPSQTHNVPEPVTLLLFGTGLLGAGAMRLRRKSPSKKA